MNFSDVTFKPNFIFQVHPIIYTPQCSFFFPLTLPGKFYTHSDILNMYWHQHILQSQEVLMQTSQGKFINNIFCDSANNNHHPDQMIEPPLP